MKNKKQIVIATSVLVLVTILLLGLTYAYYKTRINGNTKDKSINVTSKKLEITYGDGNGVIEGAGIEPGYTVTKTFTVENTGDEVVNYSIKLDNIVNTFSRTEDWTYVLKKGETEVSSGTIVSGSYQILVSSTSIDSKATDSYSLVVTYVNLADVDQSIDMGKELSLRVNIDEIKTTWNSAKEGTLLYAIKNDNTVTEPLTVPGAEPSKRTITTNFDGTESSTNLTAAKQSTLYYTYADDYKIDQKTGLITLINPAIGKYSDIYSNLVGKYVVNVAGSTKTTIANSTNLSKVYKITSASTETTSTLKYITSKTVITGTEAVLSSTEDDYGTSYYYRGVVDNNFVNFSGMCFRIVRVQGDGGVKIILDDDTYECNSDNYSKGTNVIKDPIDPDDPDYSTLVSTQILIHYRDNYSGDPLKIFEFSSSDFKMLLDAWLKGEGYNFYDYMFASGPRYVQFSKKINVDRLIDTEWCNDLSISSKVYYDDNYNLLNDSTNASYTDYFFGAYDRLINKKNPTLKCNMTGLDNTKAIKIKNKVGILTADEVVFAGNDYNVNNSKTYLRDSNGYLSPGSVVNSNANFNDGILSFYDAATGYFAVRPALVLSPDVEITSGNGTQSNPYVIN